MFKSNFSLADRISIVSDEISEDFNDASLFANKLDIKFIKIYDTVFRGKSVENLFAYFPKDVDGEVHYSPKGYQK